MAWPRDITAGEQDQAMYPEVAQHQLYLKKKQNVLYL